ncbi:protein of unknown function [Taphrina deformans PYCC 5710]|uniref:Radical SAM core domain-containing protein n=1 Tax=Taphrina deformans (strain PYCC 5710 / ATCC 11124 / CBS 356.35 / IMI 108563 / JCM 9778 / NBRC 8474) TaxID=1097556 RepID=R4XJP0_TAPDE|nr:protein of unknown function [Taphrina deformans PYCC 5710]|eukprot:CCG83565.1 protein of unknown function [Taphrina deformans PYCC 5710]
MKIFSHAISIYVHYPYCSKICTFCAFNKYKVPSNLNQVTLTQAYITELSYGLKRFKQVTSNEPVHVRSVYFGGGTPSLATWLVRDVLKSLRTSGYDLNTAEVTLEANPTSLPDVQLLRDIGVTRVSLGLQSLLDTNQLRKFNREHSAMDSQLALDRLAKDVAYLPDGFSFDLMFANPLNDKGMFKEEACITKELAVALPYAQIGGHVSLYELTVEHGTPLSKEVKAGRILMPDRDCAADEYEAAVSCMVGNGFDHYEVSSFAKPGRYGRHNFAFWMHEDLIGIGPGAHGRLTLNHSSKYRTRCIPDPTRWATQIEARGHGIARHDVLEHAFAEECIAVGLRTEVGVPRSHFLKMVGQSLESCLDMTQVGFLQEEGFLDWSEAGPSSPGLPREYQEVFKNGFLRATERGRRVLDLITPMLLRTT